MKTQDVISKMPDNVMKRLDFLKNDYGGVKAEEHEARAKIRGRVSAYLMGLMDAGTITDRERQILFIYTTL